MKILSKNELNLFENLVGVDQLTLQNVLYKFLKQHYKKVTYDSDYLVAEGDIPVALVAHMDTVFKQPASEVYYDTRKNVIWSPSGLGADDRAGVFAIIQIIKSGLRPHIIFTTDEEQGCVGSMELSYQPCPFETLKFIIQLDRRNANDCVFYDCDNDEFQKFIESFGFITAFGSFTDICELCPRWGVAGVNLSIGYRDEHTVSEVLFVSQMLDTIEKVQKILKEPDLKWYKYVPATDPYSFNYLHYFKDNYGFEDYYDFDDFEKYGTYIPKNTISYKCHKCGEMHSKDEVLEVKLIKGGKGYFCENCIINSIDWCLNCGEAYEINPKHNDGYCKSCAKKIKKGKK